MFSVFQKSVEETRKEVEERWKYKQEQIILIEVANDQYDQVIHAIKQTSLTNNEQILKYIVRSPFVYDQIRAIMESGFLLNYEAQDDDYEGDSYSYNFQGQFFLSSYLLMYYFQTRKYDYKSARKATIKHLENNNAIQTYITKLIKTSNSRKISQEIFIESKSQNYQLEQADLKNKLFNQINGKLSNTQFIQQLVRNDSKVDRALSLILPALENKIHLEQAEFITKGIEQYIISLSFNLLFPEEIDLVINEIKQLPFERLLKDNVIQEVKNILKNRQPVHINPSDDSLLYEILIFNYTSVFCEKAEDTAQYITEQFKNRSIILFEICPEQFKEVVQIVSQKLNLLLKYVQKRVVISQITFEQISMMVKSGYIQNFPKIDYKRIIFSDTQFLSFLLIVYYNHKMNGSWEESVKQAVKHMITKMTRKQLIKISDESARRKQMNTFLHPVLKEMIKKVPIQYKILEPIFSNSKLFTSASKVMRDNIVTTFGISFITAITDIRKLVDGSLSKKDFLMSQIKNISSTSVDVISRIMGSTLGPAGTIAGQYVGGQVVEFAKGKLESVLPYSLAERVSILFEQNLEDLSQNILTNDEIKSIINDLRTFGMSNFLKNLPQNPDEGFDLRCVCKEYIKQQIEDCFQKRKPIMIGKDPIK